MEKMESGSSRNHAGYHIWTDEEVHALLQAVALNKTNWTYIQKVYLPHLDINAIKNKFYKMIKANQINFDGDNINVLVHSREPANSYEGENPLPMVNIYSKQLLRHQEKLENQYELIQMRTQLKEVMKQVGDIQVTDILNTTEYMTMYGLLQNLEWVFAEI